MSAKRLVSKAVPPAGVARREGLLAEVRRLILEARQQTARAVNAGLTLLYWQVGDRIRREVLREKRAEYGAEILQTLSAKLEAEFGRGFGEKNLRRMVQFAEAFPDFRIVATLSRQLGWSHFKEILPLAEPLQRDFYAEMCRVERWSVRALRSRMDSMLYERTALSKKPKKLIEKELKVLREEDRLTPDLVFRDPYVLDFLGLRDTYGEKDLENALLREIESFLLELGAGFAFVERQKRITYWGAQEEGRAMIHVDRFENSYRVEKKAAVKIQLLDADAEIEPVPTSGGGRRPEPELDRLSNILKTFNDQFGNIPWTDADRVHKLITEDIPARVSADTAYQNAKKNSDKQNARIEHDKALARVMTAVLKDDTELFKQFMDNESFRRWLTDTVFSLTYR